MADILATTDRITREKRVLVGPPQPVMVTIYEKESGKAVEMHAVDAKEALAQEDSPYQEFPKGQKPPKPAPPDHSVTEVVGTSSTATVIESPLREGTAAAKPKPAPEK